MQKEIKAWFCIKLKSFLILCNGKKEVFKTEFKLLNIYDVIKSIAF